MLTYRQFIEQESLSMTTKRVKENPNMQEGNMDHWLCSITVKNGDVWPVYFSMGYGHNGKAPDLADVLECLASDAAGYENSSDFEDWAEAYGYDPDSRKAKSIYYAVADQINAMQAFLGNEAYDTLVWDTSDEETA